METKSPSDTCPCPKLRRQTRPRAEPGCCVQLSTLFSRQHCSFSQNTTTAFQKVWNNILSCFFMSIVDKMHFLMRRDIILASNLSALSHWMSYSGAEEQFAFCSTAVSYLFMSLFNQEEEPTSLYNWLCMVCLLPVSHCLQTVRICVHRHIHLWGIVPGFMAHFVIYCQLLSTSKSKHFIILLFTMFEIVLITQ